jgi:hypothetical protein
MNEELTSIEELTMMLMYLTSWKESTELSLRMKPPVKENENYFRRSWKGYPFEALNDLSKKGFISETRSSQPAFISPEGEIAACKLLEKYGITPNGDSALK